MPGDLLQAACMPVGAKGNGDDDDEKLKEYWRMLPCSFTVPAT